MEDIGKLLAELKGLMGKEDEKSEVRRNEIALWVREHRNPEVEAEWDRFMDEGLSEIGRAVENIRHQIDHNYDIIPMSYVARHYFGKSQSWLAQRINGYEVRGKVYTLNETQKAIFNAAMQDLSKQFGSIHIS